MADQALYRKYRSANFSEVVGQDHVVKTLTTAISSGRLSHAYLFTGPRGVGKTSVARLLARALNCLEKDKPCNSCNLCAAAINSSLDVIEIDAASNRSIDAIRELREKVGIAPTLGKYKVYIIDEVHMLTSEAFNALLKTLEEPPSHAVFILATTEAHKLPDTIVSRTQRFTFKPIAHKDIIGHLDKIAKSEKIGIEPEALEILATIARGGFRDAISMLDQMAASGERPVTAATVRALLGLSDNEAIAAVSQAIAARDAKAAIEALTTLLEQGAQPGQVAQQLAAQWREALLSAVGAGGSQAEAAGLAEALPVARLGQGVETLLEVTRSPWPRESLEVAVVRLAAADEAPRAPSAPSAAPKAASPRTAQSAPATKPAPEPEAPAAATAGGTGTELWPKVLVTLRARHNALAATLHQYPVTMTGDTVAIQSRFNFHRDLFLKPVNRKIIEEAAQKVYGRVISITAVTDESAQLKTSRKTPDTSAELVSSALEILGGEVVE